MKTTLTESQLLTRIRLLVLFFIGALAVSGITAFPLVSELELICNWLEPYRYSETLIGQLDNWICYVYEGVKNTHQQYPFMAYGTDWLAFAHLVIALAFVGVWVKPVRNIWIIYWAMLACVAVFPLAFICGSIRGIPFYWMLIDCSFGFFGMIPLLILRKYINELARISGCYVPTKY